MVDPYPRRPGALYDMLMYGGAPRVWGDGPKGRAPRKDRILSAIMARLADGPTTPQHLANEIEVPVARVTRRLKEYEGARFRQLHRTGMRGGYLWELVEGWREDDQAPVGD